MNNQLPTDLRSILSRSAGTFIQDFAGVLSLAVVVIAGLNLPDLF